MPRPAGHDARVDQQRHFHQVCDVAGRHRRDRHAGQPLDLRRGSRGDGGPPVLDRAGELGELRDGHRALQLGHAVVEREEVVVGLGVAVAPRLVDEQAHPAGQRRVVGDDDAALAGRDVLALLQAEAADGADGADRRAADCAPGRPARSPRSPGCRAAPASAMIGRHVARVAEQVRHDDRPRARRECAPRSSPPSRCRWPGRRRRRPGSRPGRGSA